MNRRFDHIIFDLDGTLIDSAPSILACFTDVLAAHGIQPRVTIDSGVIGPPLAATLTRLTGITREEDIDVLARDFKSRYDQEGLFQTRLYSGIEAQLQRLAEAGHRLHIATNKRQRPTSLILDNLGLVGRFDSVYTNDRTTPAYGNKAAMLTAQIQELGLPRERACYVGDRGEDALSAQANQLAFCFAAWGYAEPGITSSSVGWTTARVPQDLADVLLTMSK